MSRLKNMHEVTEHDGGKKCWESVCELRETMVDMVCEGSVRMQTKMRTGDCRYVWWIKEESMRGMQCVDQKTRT